jgi:hypothetical protein
MPGLFSPRTFIGAVVVAALGALVGGLLLWRITHVLESPSLPLQSSSPRPAPVQAPRPATTSPSTTHAAAHSTPNPLPPQGTLQYRRQVTVLGGGFYGFKVPLTLETIANDPAANLSFEFLAENRSDTIYTLFLSSPSDTAIVLDEVGDEYAFLGAKDIDDRDGVQIPAFGRRRFLVQFRPLTRMHSAIRLQLVFEYLRGPGGFETQYGQSRVTREVTVTNIPANHFR